MNNLLKTYNFSNFQIVKGDGCYLYTSDNKKLLDFSAGVAVNSLGYNHSVIKKTLQEQLKTGITHLSGSQIHLYKTKLYLKCFFSINFHDFGIIQKLSMRQMQFQR